MKKNILITTQILDVHDPLLGFFTEWVREFSKQYEQVTVICLKKGTYNLPQNVHVLSLGKEVGKSRLTYLFRFYKYIWQERKRYDVVFVHMNQIYVILGGLFWKIFGKKVSLWYAHGHVSSTLRIAEKMTNICFASTAEGFKLASEKLRLVGQGINTNFFVAGEEIKSPGTIVTIGRISAVKRIKESIELIAELILKNPEKDIRYNIIGVPGLGVQQVYYDECMQLVSDKNLDGQIRFLGGMDQAQILPELAKANIFLNISKTGSLDKAILEAMSAELIVVSSNESFSKIVQSGGSDLTQLVVPQDLAGVSTILQKALDIDEAKRVEIVRKLRAIVVKDHSLPGLISRIRMYL